MTVLCMIGYFCVIIDFSVFQVLNETFPDHTFLMNGLIMGIKVRDILIVCSKTVLALL